MMTKLTPLLNKNVSSLPYLITGFVTGLLLAILEHYKVSYVLPYVWIAIYGLFFLLAYQQAKTLPRLLIGTLLASFIASIPFPWLNTDLTANSFILCLVSAYAVNAFHIAYEENGLRIPYQRLFFAVWDTFAKLLLSAFFTGLCCLLLAVWESLFNIIGIHFFDTLFSKLWFTIWSTSFFIGTGLLVAAQTKKIVRHLRIIILTICKYLLPVLAAIGVLFDRALFCL